MNARTIMLALFGGGLLLLGVLIGRQLTPEPPSDASPRRDATSSESRRVLYWYDPMVPDQRFDTPGKSPFMDMMLVPRYADEDAAAGVRIDPAIQQNLGVRTATIARGVLAQVLTVPGTLQWDLRAEQRVSARVDGIVDRLFVATPFQRVRSGEPLATLLAPEWSAALAEYRALAASESAQGRELLAAARSRLRTIGLTAADIDDTASAPGGVPRITVRAPLDGVLGEIAVRSGQRVSAGDTLFRINGTAQVWMLAEIPQAQAEPGLVGQTASVRISALRGETFKGTVEALLPELDPTTRSQSARIVLDDPDARLAAGMFAEARLRVDTERAVPLVPIDAVLVGGDRDRVIVAGDDDRFLPVEVVLGRRAGDRVEVLRGLDGGERIVVSGQFLIDSEASLSGFLRRLEAPPETPHPGHLDHVMPAAQPTLSRDAESLPRRPDRTAPEHDHHPPDEQPRHKDEPHERANEPHEHEPLSRHETGRGGDSAEASRSTLASAADLPIAAPHTAARVATTQTAGHPSSGHHA